jgi:hypothetical protein
MQLFLTGGSLVLLLALVSFHTGCSSRTPWQKHYVGNFGRFEFRQADNVAGDFIVGVPGGAAEPNAVDYAESIRELTGAGLVIAFGFKDKRIAIDRPLNHTRPIIWRTGLSQPPASVYAEFTNVLTSLRAGSPRFYVGVRTVEAADKLDRIEVAAAGFSFAELKALKRSYVSIREQWTEGKRLPRLDLALDPLDDISWDAFAVRNHGVLMLADKGLIMRLPTVLASWWVKDTYRRVLAHWTLEASAIASGLSGHALRTEIERLPHGRIDSLAGNGSLPGVVIAAPHGSFDWYTGELVEELSYRTQLPAVVARGFTPTECDGWRINVNRPTERRYPVGTLERKTGRAAEVYRIFREIVLRQARGPLSLYVDVHQNDTEPQIDVATVGITSKEAEHIKNIYQEIRDQALSDVPATAKVDLAIEPFDRVNIGAWAAKDHGILRLAKRSLHFELPAQRLFYNRGVRRAYTKILAELINRIVPPLRADPQNLHPIVEHGFKFRQ